MTRFLTQGFIGVAVCGALLAGVATMPAAHAEENLTAKLQDIVGKLSTEQQASLYLLLSQLQGGGAAAPAAAAADPKEAAKAAFLDGVKKIKEAAVKQDLAYLMTIISDDFENPQVGGKTELKDFIQGAIDMGYLEMYAGDTEIKTDDTEIKVDGDKATFYPIEIEGPWGSATVEFSAKLENGKWMITSIDVSGV